MVSTKLLKKNPLFKDLSEDGLEKVLEICSEREHKAGKTVFSKGDKAENLFLLYEGECEVKVALGGTLEYYTVYRLTPGEVFGEIGFVERSERSATVKCAKNAKVLVLKRVDFDKLAEKFPEIAATMMSNMAAILARRLRETDAELQNFYLKSTVSFRKIFGR